MAVQCAYCIYEKRYGYWILDINIDLYGAELYSDGKTPKRKKENKERNK